MNLKVTLQNIGLIENLSAEFHSGNLYFIRGANQVGKTTATRALNALFNGKLDKEELRNGKDSGEVEGTITGMDGETYKVIINLKKDKNPSFTIIHPNLKKTTRKGDLSSIFMYENVTTDTFLGLGLTEPGRRQQAAMFMKLMPVHVQNEINELDAKINTKDGTLYIDRRTAKGTIDILKQRIPPTPEDEDMVLAEKVNEWEESLAEMKANLNKSIRTYNGETEKRQEREKSIATLNERKDRIEKQIDSLEMELMLVKQDLENVGEQTQTTITREKVIEEQNDYDASVIALEKAKESSRIVTSYTVANNELKEQEIKVEKLDNQLAIAREAKARVIDENIRGDITIEDGQLMLTDKTGTYPVNEKRISYSKGMMIVANLLTALNPKYPIFTLGKASELDMNSLKVLAKFAEEQDAIIMLDYVDSGDLKIEVYEQ